MKQDLIYWLRWILLLPIIILFALLSTILLDLFLFSTFSNGGLIYGMDITGMQENLTPFVTSFVLILTSYKVAPRYKLKTSFILFFVYIFIWYFHHANLQNNYNIFEMYFNLQILLGIVGAYLGLKTVKSINKREEDQYKQNNLYNATELDNKDELYEYILDEVKNNNKISVNDIQLKFNIGIVRLKFIIDDYKKNNELNNDVTERLILEIKELYKKK